MTVMKKMFFFISSPKGGGFGDIKRFDPYDFWLVFLPTFFVSGYFPVP